MLRGFNPGKIYVATGYTDLRKGIDGLAGMVQEQFRLNAFEDALFLFCGKRTDRIKGKRQICGRIAEGKRIWDNTTKEEGVRQLQQVAATVRDFPKRRY